jgi:peroxiredoxin
MNLVKGAALLATAWLTLQYGIASAGTPEGVTKTEKVDDAAKPAATTATTAGAGAATSSKATTPVDAMELTTAPDFTLKDTDGKSYTLSTYVKEGKTVVLEWFNPDCPFVKKHHQVNKSMKATYDAAAKKGVVWLAINSGAPGKQGAGLERNQKAREEYGIAYPVLLDENGNVGRAYGAKTTPQMFVIGKDMKLVYAGAIDSDASPAKLGETNYVTAALDAYAAGKEVASSRTKSYGCSVKYGEALP